MTDRAKLELEFDKRYVSGVGCFLITTINPLVTDPSELRSGLVIMRAGSEREQFIRIAASETELDTFPALPTVVDHFKSATYAALVPVAGDIIHVVSPFPSVWENIHSYVAHTYTVLDATDPADLVIDTVFPEVAFPDYGSDIRFYVTRGLTEIISAFTPATDGEADRDYSSTPTDDFYLAAEHNDFLYTGVDDALNFIEARRAEAQAIVNVMNQDIYSGITEELFE
jgi:hypothetical protein